MDWKRSLLTTASAAALLATSLGGGVVPTATAAPEKDWVCHYSDGYWNHDADATTPEVFDPARQGYFLKNANKQSAHWTKDALHPDIEASEGFDCSIHNVQDLAVDSVVLVTPPSAPYPIEYAVTVKNVGNISVDVAGVVMQGYFSADAILDVGDAPGCGQVLSVGSMLLHPGATLVVNQGCGDVVLNPQPPVGTTTVFGTIDYTDANAANNVGSVAFP